MKLAGLHTLVVDPDPFMRGLVVAMLRDFGMREPGIAESATAAKTWLAAHPTDLVITEARLPDMSCAALIHWIRRCGPMAARMMPVIVLTSRTGLMQVSEARDSGASVVVRKPISARVLHDHVQWAARSQRPFVHSSRYVGPDRRFRNEPVPASAERRLSAEEMAAAIAEQHEADGRILEHIAAIENMLALQGSVPPDAKTRRRFLKHGDAIATLAAAAGHDHLVRAAHGLSEVAMGLASEDGRGTAPIAVCLQALQLLAPGRDAPRGQTAERVLGGLTRMLAHLGIAPEPEDDAIATDDPDIVAV